ncbi:MAG TPA: glycosyltransferase family 4 protein, partial [Acidimicrobiia bacterium]|nr:glycosyltransferase family 4 protein [Acidimicrobiia bacterium]
MASTVAKLGDLAAEADLHRVALLAWRDLDDPEAGGSEVHASTVASYWAEAGLEVTMRTSFAPGRPQVSWRDGYRVIRKAGRYMVFPRAAFSEMMGWHGGRDGLVEIWNGMPFFSPLWSRTPHVTWLHHVHAEMWQMTLPPRLAAFGNFVESKLAPPLYHRTSMVTLSESSRREMVDDLGFSPQRVSVVSPGIDPHYTPGGEKSPTPLVVAVGRLVPVKQFDVLVDALVALKADHPALEAVIVGEGYTREELEAQIHAARAESWISLPGRVSEDTKVDLYRRAWVLASASAREGWGMTITEAAACGTPAVVSDVPGHADAVVDGETG